MAESYSDRIEGSTTSARSAPLIVAEPAAVSARELIARLLPGADADKLVFALLAEREGRADGDEVARYDSDEEIALRELRRIRSNLSLGESARALQHAFNNPLSALFAEAQLLELEPLRNDHRAAIIRILTLARRLVALSRQLGVIEPGSVKSEL